MDKNRFLKNKKSKLQAKFIFGLMITLIILTIVLGFTILSRYRDSMEEYYSEMAFDCATLGANYIDGDKIVEYRKTLTKDEYYKKVNEYLQSVKNSFELKYFYVVVPTDVQYYIWDVGDENDQGVCDLGDTDEFYGGGYEIMHDAFNNPNGEKSILITDNATYGYLASAYVAILDSKGNPVALSSVDISMDKINREIHQFMILMIMVISSILIFSITIYYFFIKASVINPMKKLRDAANSIVDDLENSNNVEIDIHTGDEIEELADAFGYMTLELREYINNLSRITAEKERIGAELDVANQIQASMLPSIFPPFPERSEFDIFASMIPAKEVGGDFYDFFLVDDDHLALVMADVSGKGVPAALFMVIAKTLIKNSAQTGASPKSVLETVNNQLCENNEAEMFVTVWLGIYEISTGKLIAANAGHEYPVIKRADGKFELYKDKHGFVLAGMENSRYREYELNLNAGDLMFIYTDGVAEATNGQNQLYGTERMLEALNKNLEASPENLLRALKADIDNFVGDSPQFDDITMLGLKIRNEGETKMHTMKFPAKVDQIPKATEFIETILEAQECSLKTMMQINIAIDEIFSNIVHYAYEKDDGEVVLECIVENESVKLKFLDTGKPYNPFEKEDPDISLSAEERSIGGLGIYMVKKSMDRVEYEYIDGKNVLTVEKTL